MNAKKINVVVGSFVTVQPTEDSGKVEQIDTDGTSGVDFAGVRLDHSGKLAWVPLSDVECDPAYATRNTELANAQG